MKMASSSWKKNQKLNEPMNSGINFSEPHLEFALEQRTQHPRDGITLFGPFDSKGIERPQHITYGLFGTPDGIAAFRSFSAALNRPILTEQGFDEVLWPHFPGFEESFHTIWSAEPAWEDAIDPGKLISATQIADIHERV